MIKAWISNHMYDCLYGVIFTHVLIDPSPKSHNASEKYPTMHQYVSTTSVHISVTKWWIHDDVIKWKHFPRNWPFVREIHRSPVNFPHKGQWRGALMFSLIYAWINDWVNNREAGDLRRQHGHYDVIVMLWNMRRLYGICGISELVQIQQ